MRVAVRVFVAVLLVLGGVAVAGPAGASAPENPGAESSAEPSVAPDGVDSTAAAALAGAAGGSFVGVTGSTAFAGSVPAGATKRVVLAGVPAGSAALLTISIAAPSAAGSVTGFTAGAALPSAPTLAFVAGQAVSNSAVIPTSAAGAVDVKNSSTGAATLRVDVSGYYTAGAPSSAGMFGSIGSVTAANAVAVPAQGTATITAAGIGGLPANSAIVLTNLSVAAPTGSGILTAYPTGATRPSTRNLAFSTGRPQSGLSAVRLGTAGQFTVYNSSATAVTVTAAIQGYYLTGSTTVGGSFQKVAPATLFTITQAANTAADKTVTGMSSVPASGVTAVVVELSASAATAAGYLTTYPSGATRPTVPVVPFSAGRTTSNLVTVPVNAAGRISVFNASTGSVTIRAEIVGYVLGASKLSWSAPTSINTAPAAFSAISCPSTTFCMAGDTGGFFFAYDGAGWKRISEYGFQVESFYEWFNISTISCVSSSFCAAVSTYTSDNTPTTGSLSLWDGTRWTAQPIPNFGAASVSCTSASFCLATSDETHAGWAVWNGSVWAVKNQNPSVYDMGPVSCVSSTFCQSVGYGSVMFGFNGTSWTRTTLPGATSVSCVTKTFCVAAGTNGQGNGISYTFNGTAWGGAVANPVAGAISCRTTTFCLGAADGKTAVYNGTTWSGTSAVLAGQTGTTAASCVSPTFCIAARGDSSSSFNGSAWASVKSISPDPQWLSDVSCSGSDRCTAIDQYDALSFGSTGGVTSTRLGVKMDPPSGLTTVSCPTTTFCAAATARGYSPTLFVNNGAGWDTGFDVSDDFVNIDDLSCVWSSFCAAVGNSGMLYNGTTWTATATPILSQVSCVSATFCLATGPGSTDSAPGISTVFNGSAWSTTIAVGTAGAPVSLSCRTTTSCQAVDGAGRIMAFNGTSWSTPVAIANAGPLVAVSCVTVGSCLAVSSTGKVSQKTAAGWSTPKLIDPIGRPTDISCPTAGFCAVVDDTGRAVFAKA